ncbi:MAG: hypothetical protein HY658_08520 [Actinobacteria bacterium]|nr:hypothetical protein [Actinomycetota bacterium]
MAKYRVTFAGDGSTEVIEANDFRIGDVWVIFREASGRPVAVLKVQDVKRVDREPEK